MESAALTASPSNASLWAGRIMTGLAVAFLVFDGLVKFTSWQAVVDASNQLGIPLHVNPAIGIVLLVCVALYAFPRTSVLGAILLTGYLGGAVAIHMRVGNPLFTHLLFPTYVGALIWGGLYLRDRRLRALIPLRTDEY
jgi:DoxX-like family